MPDAKLPSQIEWLADAPLFIDSDQVSRFYDAVARPAGEVVRTVDTLSEEQRTKIAAKLQADITVEPGTLAKLLSPVFSFLKPSVSIGGDIAGDVDRNSSTSRTTEITAIRTPQRRLVDLAIHYLVEQTDRLFLVDDPADEEWRNAESVAQTPRALVFLDLPSGVKLMPTAAEFDNGDVVLIYNSLNFGAEGEEIPEYPETGNANDRKQYWQWFEARYSATKAMIAVEQAASQVEPRRGRLRWIDYRLPIDDNGATLHLHVSPKSEFDTGVFAYNFIKRGFKHGVRLVGTLKSEPDMNILAIYDR